MRLPPIEIVPDDLMRQERARSLNRLCNTRDWELGRGLSLIMNELRDNVVVHRKSWEYALCIDGLTRLGCVTPQARALSVGAGYERPLYYFANRIALMVATDLYENPDHEGKPEMLTAPERFAPFEYRRDHLQVLRMSGDDLRFPDNHFDFAFSLSSIEHFGPRDIIKRSLAEMVRVVRPGGVICIVTELILNGTHHHEYFTPNEITEIFLSDKRINLAGGDFDLRIQKSLMDYPIDPYADTVGMSPAIVLRINDVVLTSLSLFLRKRAEPEGSDAAQTSDW